MSARHSLKLKREKQKAFLVAGMENIKTILYSKIAAKKAELMKTNAGGPKGKRASSSVASRKKHKIHGTAHMIILKLSHCIHYNQHYRLILIDTVPAYIVYFYLSVGGGTGITFSAGMIIMPL
jgi:hypothetical protein